CEPDDLVLRHYRYLGREETWARYEALDAKRRPGDKARQLGYQYEMPRAQFDEKFVAVVEVTDTDAMVRASRWDLVYHEHLSYFREGDLSLAAGRAGLRVD